MTALASHQCGQAGLKSQSWFQMCVYIYLLLVLLPAPMVFRRVLQSSSLHKTNISIKFQFDLETPWICHCKCLFILLYLFLYLFRSNTGASYLKWGQCSSVSANQSLWLAVFKFLLYIFSKILTCSLYLAMISSNADWYSATEVWSSMFSCCNSRMRAFSSWLPNMSVLRGLWCATSLRSLTTSRY